MTGSLYLGRGFSGDTSDVARTSEGQTGLDAGTNDAGP